MNIIVAEYNIKWPAMFQSEAKLFRDLLGDNVLDVFHIGSTSVPGMMAKPIIDIMPVVRNLEKVDLARAEFESSSYEFMGEFGMPGRRYMRKGGDNRTHQIHIFQYSSVYDITRHLVFRDYLRQNEEARKEYSSLKAGLALKYPDDIEKYGEGKDSFVKQTEKDALQWYWTSFGKE